MFTTVLRRRAAVLALALSAAVLPSAAASATPDATSVAAAPAAHIALTGHTAPVGHPGTPAAPATAAFLAAPANSCPRVTDHLFAATDRRTDLDRITPSPSWRINCKQLYRSDSRPPSVVFESGFEPRDVINGQYDIEQYVLVNQPSPFVSTSYDHDLYKTWWKSGWNYYIDAPGGIDVNQTIGDTHKWASQVEVAFPGGVATRFVVGVCPVDKEKKTEIMELCQDNPHYEPWRAAYPG
ncbi:ADP-ribosyltransferase [Streptomyces sp. NPDC089919]|uniref:ADP-ribosyltransferase n=1 Tax=Streptomyces sp. NPDC089919 TaxID=3155188 RepID=UPI00343BA9D6